MGSASVSLPPDDDGISEAITPPGGFRAFGTNYSDLYVRMHVHRSRFTYMYVYILVHEVVKENLFWTYSLSYSV